MNENAGEEEQHPPTQHSIFLRIENTLLKQLRELDWATFLLTRYQYFRFSQSLQRDIAGYLICENVIEKIKHEAGVDNDQKNIVIEIYEKRLTRRKQRIEDIARDFPEFFSRIVNSLLTRVALNVAGNWAEDALHHGEIGTKIFSNLKQVIESALAGQSTVSLPPSRVKPEELIGKIPLLMGLPETVLNRLVEHARPVTFLTSDIIIGEGEHGDALYVIRHGHVIVYREDNPDSILAEFEDGEFFGEMALLGDQVRTASVKASTPTTVYRLTRSDVLAVAELEPQLKQRLQQAESDRLHSTDAG